MALPTPSIYDYRTLTVIEQNSAGTGAAYYVPQYSSDSGSTWATIFTIPFQSQLEATQAIAKIVDNEAKFQSQLADGTFKLPVMGVTAYP